MRNEDVSAACGLKYKLSERVEQSTLRWHRHRKRTNEERLVERINRAGVCEAEKEDIDRVLDCSMLLERCFVREVGQASRLQDAGKSEKWRSIWKMHVSPLVNNWNSHGWSTLVLCLSFKKVLLQREA